MDKIIYCILCILFLSISGFSQKESLNIFPITSNRTDVTKLMGEGRSSGTNRVSYNLKSENVVITYYRSGCNLSEQKKLNISPNTVLEIAITPKFPQRISETIADFDRYEKRDLPDKHFIYFNSHDGILIITQENNSLEYTKEIYYLPSDLKKFSCVVNSFDNQSGLAKLNYAGLQSNNADRFNYPPIKIGSFFDEDSKSSKEEILNEFSKELLKRSNSFGYIVLSRDEKQKEFTISEKREKILDYLRKKGIPCHKLIFLTGGVGGLSGAYLAIVHRTFVSENKLKTACTNSAGQ